ncbi:MAG: MFS transporter [Anaerolineales bacterium]
MSADKTATLRQHPFILPVYLPTFLISLAGGILIPVLPLYLREFEVGYGLVGLVLSGQAIGMLIMDIPSGMVMRRLGQRRAMIVGLSLVALSTLALFWARSVPEALLYRIFSGMGFSVFGVSRHAYIAENAVIGVRGRAVALFGGINRIGRFSGPAIGGMIGSALSLRAPFLIMGLLISIALFLVILMVPRTRATQFREQGSLKSYVQQLWSTAKDQYRILTTVGAGQLFAQMVRTGRDVLIPLYGADVLGLDVAQIGWISTFASAIDMTLFYPVGMVMDRWGRKYAIVPSFLVQGIGLALIPLTTGFLGLAAVGGLIGFGNGLGSGTMLTLGADLAPAEVRGEFLGMWRLIGDLGFTLGPSIAGAVAAALALPAAALVMGSSGVVASMIFLFLVPETNQQK